MKTELQKLKEKLDYVFQEYIRWRDDFTCITCGAKFPTGERKSFHAGHYISRYNNSTRWDEENVNGQCATCNMKQSHCDVQVIHNYSKALNLKYGDGTVERLFKKKNQVIKVNKVFLKENIELYTKALEDIKKYKY